MAPQVGLEPTTYRLTAGCSAIELLRNSNINYRAGRQIRQDTKALARGKATYSKKSFKRLLRLG